MDTIISLIQKCIEHCKNELIIGAISAFGAIARYFHDLAHVRYKHCNIILISSILTGLFAALLAFHLCQFLGIPDPLVAPITGVVGWMGIEAINKYKAAIDFIIDGIVDKAKRFFGK